MKSTDTLVLAGSALAPLAASELTSGNPVGATDFRRISFYLSAASGLGYLVTRNSTLGALSLGSGIAWGLMKLGSGQPGII